MPEPNIILKHGPGTRIEESARDALSRSFSEPRIIGFCFNDVVVYIDRDESSVESLVKEYHRKSRLIYETDIDGCL